MKSRRFRLNHRDGGKIFKGGLIAGIGAMIAAPLIEKLILTILPASPFGFMGTAALYILGSVLTNLVHKWGSGEK